jgi:hypothetical protein
LCGLAAILKEASNTRQNTEDKRENIQGLSLEKECYSMELDLLTNVTVVDDAIRFVAEKSKYKGKDKAKDRSSEVDYNDHEDEEEDKGCYIQYPIDDENEFCSCNI